LRWSFRNWRRTIGDLKIMQNKECDLFNKDVIDCPSLKVKKFIIDEELVGVFCWLHYRMVKIVIARKLKKSAE
jgi:hypothetical protein